MTKQLLAFSRKQAIQPVPLNLNSVVGGIEKLLHRIIGEHISISTRLDSRIWPVLADAGQMEQIKIDEAVLHQEIREKKVEFLQNPFSPRSLAKKVREVLDGLPVA